MSETILRIEAVKAATGLSRSTIWRLEREGDFPRHVKIASGRAVGWPASRVEAWIRQRIAAADSTAITERAA